MFIQKKEDIKQPIVSPGGDVVYELIGKSTASGNIDKQSLAVIVIPPNCSSTKHFHKEEVETYYILAGSATITIDGKELSLNPGQACLIQPPEFHQITNTGKTNLEFIAICTPAWVGSDTYYE